MYLYVIYTNRLPLSVLIFRLRVARVGVNIKAESEGLTIKLNKAKARRTGYGGRGSSQTLADVRE